MSRRLVISPKTIKYANNDYIDWRSIYEKVKKNHLKQYPTAESYIEELKSCDEPYEYVEEMYRMFAEDFTDIDVFNSDNYNDYSFRNSLLGGQIYVEFSNGGNNATESGDDY